MKTCNLKKYGNIEVLLDNLHKISKTHKTKLIIEIDYNFKPVTTWNNNL